MERKGNSLIFAFRKTKLSRILSKVWNRIPHVSLLVIIYSLSIGNLQGQFRLLSPAESGVTFNNIIADEKDHNILIYSNYYGGAGVGVGDFNKDGLQDLFFAGNLVDDQLYYNVGNLKFAEHTEASGITAQDGWSSGVVVADVNNDSWPDIYVTRELYDHEPDRRRNKLYINTGKLTTSEDGIQMTRFVEKSAEYGIDNSERTRGAVFFDYNNDNLLDLFLLNQPPNPGNYSEYSGMKLTRQEWAPRLFKNTGQGNFIDVTLEANLMRPCYPNSVSASDFNNDGFIDLYVSNDYEAPDHLWMNKGDGTFENIIQDSHKHISYYSMGVDVADINNDMQLEIMTLDMVAEDNFRQKANMSGMNPEAFWKLYELGGHRQYMYNGLQINNGNSTFSDIAQMAGLANTDWSWSNLIADFDNDGWKDIHITNGLLRDIRNTDAAKTFPDYVRKVIKDYLQENPNAGDVSIFDFLDLDEALDLIPSVPLENFFFKNNGDLSFSKSTADFGLNQSGFSTGSAYADLDNDGDLEIIVSNINEPAFIYENNTEQNWLRIKLQDEKNRPIFGSKVRITTAEGAQFYEFTNVRGMYSSSENIAHFGLKTLSQVDQVEITWPDGHINILQNIQSNQLLKVDWDEFEIKQAQKVDLEPIISEVSSKLSINYKHSENNFDDYAKQILLPHKMSQFGPAIAKGDINNDGLEDLFLGGAVGQKGTFFLQSSNGLFKESKQLALSQDSLFEDLDAVLIDFDQDEDLDLYVVSGGNAFPPQSKLYQDRLYINDGGEFRKSKGLLPIFRESGSVVKPMDFDNDGDLDLFVGGRHSPWDYPTPTVSRLFQNEDGVYKDITKSNAAGLINIGMVTDAIWSDVDGDFDQDLIIVGEWMSPQILINEKGMFEKKSTNLDNYVGWLYSIEAADLDNDGDEDYVIGNLGLNYKYKASQDEPFEVHYGDFDQSGQKDIVLSYYNYGTQFPLRGRSCSAQQVPELNTKFPSYDIFASSDLETVYSIDDLDAALNYSATNFGSAVLINNGNLNFEIKLLPNEAQLSSINDIIIEDFDLDGLKDLIIAGNLYTSEIETPRNDAGIGLLLTGNGDGSFKAIPSQISNFYNSYDSKKLIKLNTRFGTMLISANNDDEITIFSLNQKKSNN